MSKLTIIIPIDEFLFQIRSIVIEQSAVDAQKNALAILTTAVNVWCRHHSPEPFLGEPIDDLICDLVGSTWVEYHQGKLEVLVGLVKQAYLVLGAFMEEHLKTENIIDAFISGSDARDIYLTIHSKDRRTLKVNEEP